MNATTTMSSTLSARVASGVTAEYVRALSRSGSAPGGARRRGADEPAARGRVGLPALRRARRVRGDAPAPRRPRVAARAR
jgi:hypothetical protein